MARSGKYRSWVSLALLRLSDSDLRSVHATVSELNPSSFLELIRDIENEIDNSVGIVFERAAEQEYFNPDSSEIYHQIDQIRRKELRVSVGQFSDMLVDYLSNVPREKSVEIPNFEPRRGLKLWIAQLIRAFPAQDVLHAAMRIRQDQRGYKGSDWKLR